MKMSGRLTTVVALNLVMLVFAHNKGSLPADDKVSTNASLTETEAFVSKTTVNEARRQAEILHSTLHSSLRVIHDRYYKEDEGLPIPAAILGEVFRDVEAEQRVKLRWLAVEGLAMNSDHKPADEFERQAVDKLKSGERSHEVTGDGIYRRAAPITLSSHCLKCHMPDRKSTRDRVAGLIISVPIAVEDGPSDKQLIDSN
ncbi:MAG: DUF3365 domain-containing protein [Planctomycetaceae bacterium]